MKRFEAGMDNGFFTVHDVKNDVHYGEFTNTGGIDDVCKLLNDLISKLEYQKRVIDKCIRLDKKHTTDFKVLQDEVNRLEQEKSIYHKLLLEEISSI